ncbi:MAG: NADH-quinone oxidoreductase subunit A [Tepidisphaeraceae bacterium]
MLPLLADVQMSDPRLSWVPIILMLLIAIGFVVGTALASAVIGPSRTGKVKEGTYESGMNPVGTARKRFNVRFYLVAIMFVAFDVEIVVMYPWAASFARVLDIDPVVGQRMFIGVGIFITLVLVGYLYDIAKGVLKWN